MSGERYWVEYDWTPDELPGLTFWVTCAGPSRVLHEFDAVGYGRRVLLWPAEFVPVELRLVGGGT